MKHLIVIHGRSIKPAEEPMSKLVKKAVLAGLERAGFSDVAEQITSGAIKLSFVYYGDINNKIQSENNPKDRAALEARDPLHGDEPALKHTLIEDAMELSLKTSKKFTKQTYKHVLDIAEDRRFRDEIASITSMFGALTTFGFLNEKVIEKAKPDMAAYLLSQKTGSAIRGRLQDVLIDAIKDGDDIMLISHSMGCMVAYDVFWKISHMSEYQEVREKMNPVEDWVTIGCPLAEPGVHMNLRDGHMSAEDKYPRNQVRRWYNYYAKDDFISHRGKMKPTFSKMMSFGTLEFIKDKETYNCWIYRDAQDKDLISNPHDLYGYLVERHVSGSIANWATRAREPVPAGADARLTPA